jgi:hypothetical protein
MPRPKDTGKKSMGTSRASNRKGNASDVQKAISANTKKYKAMTPAQKKAYNTKQVKSVVKGAAQVASMVGGAGLARKGGVAAAKAIASKKFQKNLRNEIVKGKGNKGERQIVNQMANSWDKTLKNTGTKFIGGNRKKAYQLAAEEYEFNSPRIGQALKSKGPKDLAKMKNALINNVNSKNLKGKIGKTPASQPSRLIDRNIAKHSALRKKFPDKFKP